MEVVFEIHDILRFLQNEANEFSFVVLADKEKFENLVFKSQKDKYFKGVIKNHVILANTLEGEDIKLEELITEEFIYDCENGSDRQIYVEKNILYSGIELIDFSGNNVGEIVLFFDQNN